MKKMNLKKKKKKRSVKLIFALFLFVISFCFTIKNISKNKVDINNKDYLSLVINDAYKNKNNATLLVGYILKVFSDIDINSPETFLTFNNNKSSSKKEIKEEYIKEDDYDPNNYDKITSYITVENDIKDPILYLYNTHQLETYSNLGLNNNMVPNVMMASSLLKDKLNKNGIKTIFEDTNLFNFISEMGLPKDELYGGSRVFISNAKEKYPTLKYFIDIHRDSVNKDISTINIDNKNYARILFVLGVTNSNYKENNVMMSRLSEIINTKYPKLSRGVYEVDIPDWPEIYNQDLDKNVILIELGAKDNTMNEVINSVDVLSDAIKEYIKEDK